MKTPVLAGVFLCPLSRQGTPLTYNFCRHKKTPPRKGRCFLRKTSYLSTPFALLAIDLQVDVTLAAASHA